jgi:hypothetical protein
MGRFEQAMIFADAVEKKVINYRGRSSIWSAARIATHNPMAALVAVLEDQRKFHRAASARLM